MLVSGRARGRDRGRDEYGGWRGRDVQKGPSGVAVLKQVCPGEFLWVLLSPGEFGGSIGFLRGESL